MVRKVTNAPHHVIITWITDDVRAPLKYRRETYEGFMTYLEQNKRNKTERPSAKIGQSQGSISATMLTTKLARLLNRRPSAAELFVATHSKVDRNGQRVWYDASAQSDMTNMSNRKSVDPCRVRNR